MIDDLTPPAPPADGDGASDVSVLDENSPIAPK